MPAQDDILEHLDPAVRQRVEADWSRFAPFVGLLSAWRAAVDEHLQLIEENVTRRLAEQFFPEGDWRFPAQTLAVPDEPLEREISGEMPFVDPFAHATWTPCGRGWTRASKLASWTVIRGDADECALLCEVFQAGSEPGKPLLTPERGQLGFVRGAEPLVGALAEASWAVQYPGKPWEPVVTSRYQGYLEFEREMFVSGMAQRHLEGWLPPCHPYSRKFLHWSAPAGSSEAGLAEQWAWLDEVAPFQPAEKEPRLRLAARIDESTADLLANQGDGDPLVLNAVPVAQMAVLSQPIVATLHTVGDSYQVTFAGVSGFFAAAGRAGDVVHRVRFARKPPMDPRSRREGAEGLEDVDVSCDQTASEVRLYYGCLGEDPNPGREHPEYLTRPLGQRFSVPLPSVGGVNLACYAHDPQGARRHWYNALLRPTLLTEGDVREILQGLPVCRAFFDLETVSLQLDVINEPWVQRTPWDTYLWPSIVSDASLLDLRTNYLTASRVPIIPLLRLWLGRRAMSAPAFLMDDLARYAASVLSRYFMVGWYRVEGRVGGTP